MTEYWFARRYPLSSPRRAMAPVHWKGWLVMLSYALGLVLALVVAGYFYEQMDVVKGALGFVLIVFVMTMWYFSVRRMRGERIRSVADYDGGKPRV
jgi:hypothetical protein